MNWQTKTDIEKNDKLAVRQTSQAGKQIDIEVNANIQTESESQVSTQTGKGKYEYRAHRQVKRSMNTERTDR